jgi:hypothetical protein
LFDGIEGKRSDGLLLLDFLPKSDLLVLRENCVHSLMSGPIGGEAVLTAKEALTTVLATLRTAKLRLCGFAATLTRMKRHVGVN